MCIFCLSNVYIVLLSPDETLEQDRDASRLLSAYCIQFFSVYCLFFSMQRRELRRNTLVSLV